MSFEGCQLKVEGLPQGINEKKLKCLFSNRIKRGGGPVRNVELSEKNNSAIITFVEESAVQIVLQRGTHVEIDNVSCKVFALNHQTPSIVNKATIQMNIKNVKTHRDICVKIYLDGLDEKFHKEMVFIDGFKKAVFVPFKSPQDADHMMETFKSNPNIESIGLAEDEIHDHYTYMLSILGADFMKYGDLKLMEAIKEMTNISPYSVIRGEDSQSAIVVFEKDISKSQLYSVGWDLCSHMITAPVKRSSTICVRSNENPSLDIVEGYFKNKKHSGGGPIQSLSDGGNGSFFVTFENAADVKSVLDKKDHMFAGKKLIPEIWYDCLSRDYLNASGATVQPLSGGNTKASSKRNVPNGKTDTLEVEQNQYDLLQRSKFIKLTIDDWINVVEYNDDNKTITIKGNDKLRISVKNKIKEELLKYETEILDEFDDFLCEPHVLKKINEIFAKEEKLALLQKKEEGIICFRHEKQFGILNEMRDRVQKDKKCMGERIVLLTSEKGKEHISTIECKTKIPCKIMINTEKREVEMISFDKDLEDIDLLFYKIDQFCRENEVKTNRMQFHESQIEYAQKYLQLQEKIESLQQKTGASVKRETGCISVTGMESVICQAEETFGFIRHITMQENNIKYFGIKEYLSSDDGKSVMMDIGTKHSCLLTLCDAKAVDGASSNSSSESKSTLMGSCQLDKIKVKFVMGDLTSLDVNVIVNPVDCKLQCRKGLNKALVQNGGDEIQNELDRYSGCTDTGTVIETSGGRLPYSVYHLILTKDTAANKLLCYVLDCLRKADQDGHKSIAMPLVGCGRFRMPELGVSINIAQAVKKLDPQATSIDEVIFCDINPVPLKSIMGRFDDVDEVVSFDAMNSTQDGNSKDLKRQKSKSGNVHLEIKSGDILQEKCDVIASGIKDSMKLSSGAIGKSMLRMCGDSLQNECNQKAKELSQKGAVVIQPHGLSCKAVIFVSMTKYSSSWHKGVEKVLSLAEKNGYSNIAIPVFGAGSKHANIPKIKDSILEGIETFGNKKPEKLKHVKIVIFDDKTYDMFNNDNNSNKRSFKKGYKHAAPVVSETAQISVTFKEPDCGINAVKALKQKCDEKFEKHTIEKYEEINHLSNKETEELYQEGLKHLVKVSVEKHQNKITLGSFKSGSIYEMISVWSDMRMRVRNREDNDKIRLTKPSIKWQFMAKNKRWRDFEPKQSADIEKAFSEDRDSCELIDPNDRKYKIKFQDMKEYRVRSKCEEEIATINRYDTMAEGRNNPKFWKEMDKGENLKVVEISNTSKEYKEVETDFNNSCGPGVSIKKIEQIQNVVLYQQYAAKKDYFEKTNPKGTENEKSLFHGTDPAAIANINESGFNRSFCGKNATAYGKGVYFARKASYSVNYARADGAGSKMMYRAKVLVGESTPSNSSMNFLPNKPGSNRSYDSGTGPDMFIIFHDCQAYPEFLITFH